MSRHLTGGQISDGAPRVVRCERVVAEGPWTTLGTRVSHTFLVVDNDRRCQTACTPKLTGRTRLDHLEDGPDDLGSRVRVDQLRVRGFRELAVLRVVTLLA
jgi:hypothetical protein